MMPGWIKKTVVVVLCIAALFCVLVYVFSRKEVPERIEYGISYNTPYAHELGLDEREVFDAIIEDLGVRKFRLAAHWTIVEENQDLFDFEALDYQVAAVEEVNGSIIFGVGRRLPRWPECHVPEWAKTLSWEAQKEEIREYITATVLRYKNSNAITHWQVENEPYLEVFARNHCGELDEVFLEEEIALVRSLDPTRPILVTDSGNLGLWKEAYKRGDSFGTSMYVYFWNPELGQFRTVLPPWFYRLKENLMHTFYGEKETMLIELSAEPWLVEPVADVPIETQFTRMDIEKFDEIIEYARDSRFREQYLWGGEWWYWLKEQGHPEFWERGKALYNEGQ